MAMTMLGQRLRAGCYEEVALSLALGLARALAQLPPDGLEGLLEVLEGAGPGPLRSGPVGARSPRPSGHPPRAKALGRGEETSPLQDRPRPALPSARRRRGAVSAPSARAAAPARTGRGDLPPTAFSAHGNSAEEAGRVP